MSRKQATKRTTTLPSSCWNVVKLKEEAGTVINATISLLSWAYDNVMSRGRKRSVYWWNDKIATRQVRRLIRMKRRQPEVCTCDTVSLISRVYDNAMTQDNKTTVYWWNDETSACQVRRLIRMKRRNPEVPEGQSEDFKKEKKELELLLQFQSIYVTSTMTLGVWDTGLSYPSLCNNNLYFSTHYQDRALSMLVAIILIISEKDSYIFKSARLPCWINPCIILPTWDKTNLVGENIDVIKTK